MIQVFILIKECVWSSRPKLPRCQAHSHSLAYTEEDYVKALVRQGIPGGQALCDLNYTKLAFFLATLSVCTTSQILIVDYIKSCIFSSVYI